MLAGCLTELYEIITEVLSFLSSALEENWFKLEAGKPFFKVPLLPSNLLNEKWLSWGKGAQKTLLGHS